MSSLPKTVTRQRRGCDLNPGPSAPESSTLTTRLPSHPHTIRAVYVMCGNTDSAAVKQTAQGRWLSAQLSYCGK